MLCLGRCRPLNLLNSFLSYAHQLCGANPVSLFTWLLAFPQLLSNHRRSWQHPLDCSFGSPHSHLEVRNHWWLWHFLFIDVAGSIFISHFLLARGSAVISFQSEPSPYTSTPALRPSVFSRVQVSFKNSLIEGEGSLDNPNGFLSCQPRSEKP